MYIEIETPAAALGMDTVERSILFPRIQFA